MATLKRNKVDLASIEMTKLSAIKNTLHRIITKTETKSKAKQTEKNAPVNHTQNHILQGSG